MNLATKHFIEKFQDEPIFSLALRAKSFPDVDISLAIRQIDGLRTAREKLPTWFACPEILYPEHLSLEQCSSEKTARYKANLVSGNKLLDLTGGFGVDCFFMAQNFSTAVYVERNCDLCEIVRQNFEKMGAKIDVFCEDSVRFLQTEHPKADVVFIDPARRDGHGEKVFSVADCEPNLLKINDLLFEAAPIVVAKLSPMLDVAAVAKTLPNVREIHAVAVENECKELLAVLEKNFVGEPQIVCVNLSKSSDSVFRFSLAEERTATPVFAQKVENFLYEPNSAILKAGAFKSVATQFGLSKLHVNSHLYTSKNSIPEFQGRQFEVVRTFGFSKKELAELRKTVAGKCNLTVRNFPLSVAELRKKLQLKEGGDLYLFATTLGENHALILCKKMATR